MAKDKFFTALADNGKQTAQLWGPSGGIVAGTNGQDGDIGLFQTTDSDWGDLKKATIHLDGGTGDIRAGGNGQAGELALFKSDTPSADVTTYNKAAVHIDGNRARVRVGGNGIDGEIWLFSRASSSAEVDSSANATIHLDGLSGDIILRNADCAEDFSIQRDERIVPGCVMVIDEDGSLRLSSKPYDRCVAGVVSGAGDLKPGIILGRTGSPEDSMPIALTGRVYCQVDARDNPVRVGDLLTTSTTPGFAMRADDPMQAFGAVIGKALRPLSEGTGLIPILVALQ